MKIIAVFLMFAMMTNSAVANSSIIKIKAWKLSQLPKGLTSQLFGIGNQQFLEVANKNNKLLKQLYAQNIIAYKEPVVRYYPLELEPTFPSDPLWSEQWGFYNLQKTLFGAKRGEDGNLPKAWEISRGDKRIIVAVIDSGIDINHPDLKKNLWINKAELNGKDNVDDDHNGYVDDIYGYDFRQNQPLKGDPYGHGTHCAGIIGASHNMEGVAGVMDEVRLMGVKFFDGDGGTSVEAMKAISYAVANGATILSNSWGGFEFSQAMQDLIAEAGSRGVTFVAAAGNSYANSDTHPLYPASYPLQNIISVGSMTSKGNKSSFSNYGKESVHVFAPGSSILSTYPGGGYEKLSGTSMAAPMVAGVVGLMLSVDNSLKPEDIRQHLIDTSKQTGALRDRSQSGGHIDAARALEELR